MRTRRKVSQPRKQNATTFIAIDTGGTFTDCVWVENGRVRLLKVFSTPNDPSQAILSALERISPQRALVLLHGSTVGTNALLQRRGARVAFVTTRGFEDSLEIGRQARPKLYDFFFDRIEPLVPADLRFGVDERVDTAGQLLRAPSQDELSGLVAAINQAKPEAVAVSLLFSFVNPANERAVGEALRRSTSRDDEMPLSLSHLILPEFREYERASTVVMNAYLQPVMQRYLGSLARKAQSWTGDRSSQAGARIFVMQSNGGITAISTAAREPVRTVLSGPAGGVVGALAMAQRSGFDRIISFDMGGTSTDVALVDRELRAGSEGEVAGLPVRVPMLDIHTVGAGGGSIARFDAAGALRVGPESAGADPGPICYGKGEEPTVTDANLLLGRLPANEFLGGEFTLDLERTKRKIREWLRRNGSPMDLQAFAEGVIRVVNVTMEKAIRVVSIERGYDPREFAMVAFGGAGGMHACELAAALGIPRVIIPALPGALSAFGILVSDIIKDHSRTVLWRSKGELPLARLETEFTKLERSATRDFQGEGWSGAIRRWRSVDVRYRGQGYELNVPFTRNLLHAFHREHQRRYGYSHLDREVELVTLRLRSMVRAPGAGAAHTRVKTGSLKSTRPESSGVVFNGRGISTPIYGREQLRSGRKLAGPAVVTEYSATTIVPPGMKVRVDDAGNLIVEIG